MRKNVIMIMTDDQGAWTLGCSGCPEAHTPNIDRLAANGVRFENYFCVSPVCSPARASIFTGNIPSAHGVTDWIDNGDIDASKYEVTRTPMYQTEKEVINYLEGQTTYTDVLAENGYTCALAGKWHLGNSVQPQHGFTKWFSVPLGHSPYIDPPIIENGEVIPGKGFVTDMITDKTIEYLKELGPESKAGDHPFYISVHYTAPHSPWGRLTQPEEWYEYYKDCNFDSVAFDDIHPNAIFSCESPYFAFGSVATGEKELRRELLSGYFGAIAAMDRGVGQIYEELKEQGLLEDTIIIFTSDNGMSTGQHGIWGKGNGTYPQNMYEEAVKIPFIISCPTLDASGTVKTNLYSHYDLFPTLVDLLDLKLTEKEQKTLEKLPGRSYLGELEHKEESEEDKFLVIYSEYGPVRMIRNKEWKYIHVYPHGPNQLYDLKNDPKEYHNLIDDPKQQERINRMKYELDQWFVKYVDPNHDATKDDNVGKGQIYLNGTYSGGRQSFKEDPSIGVPYMDAIDLMKKQLERYIPKEDQK